MNLFLKGLCAIAPLLVHSDAIDDFLESYSSSFKDAPVILDCGANQGGSSQVLYNIFPKGEIVAVEADPDVYKQLVKSTENNPSIKAFNYALCKKDGYISFYENENKSKALEQGSIFPESKTNWYWRRIHLNKRPINVPARTLDSFCSENGIKHIDLMYLDMQGAEYEMIAASKKIINTVSAIVTEVCFEEIYDGIPLYNDMIKLLEKLGFKQVILIKRHKSWGDAVFVRIKNNVATAGKK